jgi:uncharacterized damage-inducible protein DinB
MNADAIRMLFDYHVALNRRLWDEGVSRLDAKQFTRDVGYSLGSVRNQVVHVASVDQRWFARLRGGPVPERLDPAAFPDQAAVRSMWDGVEAELGVYLRTLTDAAAAAPITFVGVEGRSRTTPAWHVLVHVVNHGTDHRAQILSMLHGLGAPTLEQDLMLWLRDRR